MSDYVELAEGITITGGRSDERATSDANQLTLTLDNRDGRFTAGRSGSPYYPNVKLDRPIRVTSTPVDGAAQVEFLGFVNEWPLDWSDGTDASAYATVTASSRLARLGLTSSLKSIVETAILADGPALYYTLGEPEGSTAANDSSGNRADSLTLQGNPALPVVFGNATGPGTDGLTAAQFQGGQSLASPDVLTWAGGGTIECFILRNGSPTNDEIPLTSGPNLRIRTDGFVYAFASASGLSQVVAGVPVCDGRTHHVALTIAAGGGTWTLYVDGVLVNSTALGPVPVDGPFGVGDVAPAALPFTGVVAHAAMYQSELIAAKVADHAAAGLTGFAGELTSVRLVRYAGYAGIEAAGVSTETGQTTVQTVDTTGKQVLDLMRLMETTEGGVLFDGRDGTLTFHNRGHRITAASAFSLDMAKQHVEAGYAPKLDRSALANDVSAADTSGQFTAHAFDAASQTDYGVAALSIETASQDDDEPLFQAGWALYKYKTPGERVPSLTVDALAQVGKTPNCATVMAATVGTKITVANRPTQAATSSVDYFVEGWTKVYGPESFQITWNLSPSSPDDLAFKVGDAARGVVGTNPIAL